MSNQKLFIYEPIFAIGDHKPTIAAFNLYIAKMPNFRYDNE
jgi:hypothetical protein